MSELNDMFEKDSLDKSLPDDSQLKQLANLAQMQVNLENEIILAEERAVNLKRQLAEIQDKTIPDLMFELGMRDFRLTTGERIKVDKLTFASITEKNREACFNWLMEHGFAGIIKNEVKIDAGKSSDEKVDTLMQYAKSLGLMPKVNKNVHPQTLKAFVNEQMEKAVNIPMDLFGVFIVNRAKITN
jgi:hypothetical protein